MTRGRRWLLILGVLAVLGVLLVGSLFLPGSPTRFFAGAVLNHECFLSETDGDDRPVAIGLGDSITRGHGLTWINGRAGDSYFDVLACEDDSPIAFGGNDGVWNQTTAQILDRTGEVVQADPDVVFLLAGANDIQGQDTDESIDNIAAMVDQLTNADIDVVLGTTTPLDRFPDDVQEFNAELTAWAATAPVTIVDYWSIVAAPDGTYAPGMTRDGIHPSADAAHLMAAAAREAVERATA